MHCSKVNLWIKFGAVYLYHHWFGKWLIVCSVPSHYLNQWWHIVKWTLRTNSSVIWIKLYFSFNGLHLKLLANLQPSCWGLNVSNNILCARSKVILFHGIHFSQQNSLDALTHWSLRVVYAHSWHITFSNAFSLKKIFILWLQFHWSILLEVPLTTSHCCHR